MPRALWPCLLVALAAASAAVGSVTRGSENSRTYADRAGEDPAAPDIRSIRVANDDTGRITFRIGLANRPTLRQDMRLSIYIDADDDPATGLAGGSDVRLLYDEYLHGDRKLWLLRCSGTVCSSLGGTKIPLRYAGGPVFTVDRAELDDTERFRFSVVVMDGIVFDPETREFDLTNAHADTAPDAPLKSWAYDVRIGPRRLLVRRFSTMPAQPIAGRPFVALLEAARDDTGAALTRARITCRASVGGAPARLARRVFAGGTAFCQWLVPVDARGTTMRGSIAVSSSGKTVSRSFAKKVS